MKKSSFMVLFLTFVLSVIVAFAAIFEASAFTSLEINFVSNPEVQTLICSFTEHNGEYYHNDFHSKNQEQNRRVKETEHGRNLSLILSRDDSVRILENIKVQHSRVTEALSEKNCRSNLFISSSEQSAVSKNKSCHSETRRNIQQRK